MTKQEIKFLRKTIIDRDIKDKEEWKLSRELIKKCYEELIAMGYEIPLFSNLDELVVLKAEEVFSEFEDLKKEYKDITENADKEYGENSIYFKLGTLKAELKHRKGLSQEQILELMEILF